MSKPQVYLVTQNHLHKSILVRLWNAIECSRPDCMFLYITHNLDFASSRINSQIVWVKEFFVEDGWKYDLLDDINSSDSLKLEIMGNRQKVLLVEGTASKSIDRKLYSKVYPEFNIIPMESCNAVVQTTKAYNQTNNLHYEEVKGIIDRDRRDEEEIAKLKKNNIFVPKVAEIENLFLITDVIRIVAEKQDKSEIEQIICEVQNKTFEFLNSKIEEQALLFVKQKSQNYIVKKINEQVSTIEEYKIKLSELISVDDLQSMYDQEIEKMNKIIEERNYLAALRVINNKGLLPYTQLPNKFGWKKDYYIDYVLLLLEKKDTVSNELKEIFRQYIAEL